MISSEDFKKCLGRFASGVTVITYSDGNEKGGITVSSFASVSMDPPLVLFSILKKTPSHDKLLNSKNYAINILTMDQETVSNSFANPKIDRNEYIKSIPTEEKDGIPLILGSLSILFCSNHKVIDGGDHSIFLALVESGSVGESDSPLVYYNKAYRKIS